MRQEALLFTQIQFEDLKSALTDIVRTELKNELQALDPKPKSDDLLTRKQVATLLRISFPTLLKLTLDGKIPAHRIGARVRYRRSEVEKALTQMIGKK